MADINKAILLGRLTRDCEFKQLTNTTVCNFSIAVNRKIRGADNNWNDEVSYFDVELYGKIGEAIKGYLVRGKQVALEGSLRQQRWEASDGQKRSRIVIVANSLQLLGGGQAGNQGENQASRGNAGYQDNNISQDASTQNFAAPPDNASSNSTQDFDDDIPF